MKQNKLVKPQFLSLDQETKQKFFDDINNTNLDNNFKQIAKESLLFIDEFSKRINNRAINFQQINKPANAGALVWTTLTYILTPDNSYVTN